MNWNTLEQARLDYAFKGGVVVADPNNRNRATVKFPYKTVTLSRQGGVWGEAGCRYDPPPTGYIENPNQPGATDGA